MPALFVGAVLASASFSAEPRLGWDSPARGGWWLTARPFALLACPQPQSATPNPSTHKQRALGDSALAQIWGALPGHPAGDNVICLEEASCISVLFKESRWSPVSALKGSVELSKLGSSTPLPCLSLPRRHSALGEGIRKIPCDGERC